MLGLETALGVVPADSPRAGMPLGEVVARAVVEAGGDRRASPTATAGRSRSAEPANLAVFDPDEAWAVRPAELASRSRNTPYVRPRRCAARVRHTVLRGTAVGRSAESSDSDE